MKRKRFINISNKECDLLLVGHDVLMIPTIRKEIKGAYKNLIVKIRDLKVTGLTAELLELDKAMRKLEGLYLKLSIEVEEKSAT